jgi:hypothetical protein
VADEVDGRVMIGCEGVVGREIDRLDDRESEHGQLRWRGDGDAGVPDNSPISSSTSFSIPGSAVRSSSVPNSPLEADGFSIRGREVNGVLIVTQSSGVQVATTFEG